MRRKTLRHHSAYLVKVTLVREGTRGETGVKASLVKAKSRQITRSVWN